MPFGIAALFLFAPFALAASGHANLQAYFQETLTDTGYQQKAFARVAAKWRQPARRGLPALGKKAVVKAVIDRGGKLVSTEVSMSSGSKAWDRAALRAVRRAAPFPPLPEGYAYPTVEAHFHIGWDP
jgi:protein TonB